MSKTKHTPALLKKDKRIINMIKLEGNSYIIFDEDGNYLSEFDRSKFGDEIAKKLAKAYYDGYLHGCADSESCREFDS